MTHRLHARSIAASPFHSFSDSSHLTSPRAPAFISIPHFRHYSKRLWPAGRAGIQRWNLLGKVLSVGQIFAKKKIFKVFAFEADARAEQTVCGLLQRWRVRRVIKGVADGRIFQTPDQAAFVLVLVAAPEVSRGNSRGSRLCRSAGPISRSSEVAVFGSKKVGMCSAFLKATGIGSSASASG